MKRFGIIGFGRFGQLAARHLRDHFSVVVTDTADVGEAAAAIGVKTGSLADAADCDVVMLAVPVQAMAATIAAIAPLSRPTRLPTLSTSSSRSPRCRPRLRRRCRR